MFRVEYIYMAVCLLFLFLTSMVILHYRAGMKKTLDKIEDMIDKATNHEFVEADFNETRLSRLEGKFYRYISGCEAINREGLRDRNRVNTLISDISHQTKTPIANILLYTQLLNEKQVPAESEMCMRELSKQSEKLSFLIDSLIKASRLENGVIVVKPEINSIRELLEEVLTESEAKAKAKNVKVEQSNISGQARFDFKWTAEAVYNVIDNAIKYSPSGSMLSICVTEFEMFSRIEIRDQGIGIDESEQEKIFQRFYRSADVRTEEGVGIGLFIAREIISAQGGYMLVKSKKKEGSTFFIFLPR